MRSIFISYRRDDTAGYAGRLHEVLAGHFGDTSVFRDIDAIQPGTDFVRSIEAAVARSGAVIVLMGRDWVTITDQQGGRRLDDPTDFVRLEIALALEHGIDVIPVLVEGAQPPSPASLPGPLAPLARLQAIEITEQRWKYDVGRLVSRLEEVLGPPSKTPVSTGPVPPTSPRSAGFTWTSRRRALAGAALIFVLLAGVGLNKLGIGVDPAGRARSASSDAGADTVQVADVNKSIWYGGFKIVTSQATLHTVESERRLDLPVILENQGDSTKALEATIFVSSKGQNYEVGSATKFPNVPGRATGKGTMSFRVDRDFYLGDAVITFGGSDKAQAILPLGSSGLLQPLQPVPVRFTKTRLTAGVLSLDVRGGEIRADDPTRNYRQASKGHRVLILDIASVTTTGVNGYNVFDGNILVKLPDGTTVAGADLNEAPYRDKPARDFHASYLVNDPPAGSYTLILKDTQGTMPTASADFTVG